MLQGVARGGNVTILGINAAARAAGVARSTIQRAIKNGRLSATSTATGERGIDLAELLRVFGPLPPSRLEQATASLPPAAPTATGEVTLIEVLQGQLQQALERERLTIERAQDREARLLSLLEAEQQTRAALEQKLLPPPMMFSPPNRARWWVLGILLLVALVALVITLVRPELVGRLTGG